MHNPGIDFGIISSQFNIEIPLKRCRCSFSAFSPGSKWDPSFCLSLHQSNPNSTMLLFLFKHLMKRGMMTCFSLPSSGTAFRRFPPLPCRAAFSLRISIITSQKGSAEKSYRHSLFLLMSFLNFRRNFPVW